MINLKSLNVLTILFLLCFTFPVGSAEKVDLPNPECIDPFDPKAGDFLDLDQKGLQAKAYEAYQSGNYENSARYYLALLKSDIGNITAIYNLACCYGLLGRDTLAADYLRRSVKAGWKDLAHLIQDPDFSSVRGKPYFDTAIDSISSYLEKFTGSAGEVKFIETASLIKYRICLPEAFNPEDRHKLVIGLHGYGDRVDSFIRTWERFENPDFIFVALEAPYEFSLGNKIGYSWIPLWEVKKDLWNKAGILDEEYILKVIETIKSEYQISDTYLMGFSQGAILTYHIGLRNHELFKGLIPCSGWLEDEIIGEEALKAAKDTPLLIIHGTEDKMVEYSAGVRARDFLKDNGNRVDFFEFEGGHTIPKEAIVKMQEWIGGGE